MKISDKNILVVFLLAIFAVSNLQAQYFGRNKPRYHSFDFKVKESEHFDVHHYCDNEAHIIDATEALEVWYNMHQEVLRDTFDHKNPVIFYNDHADFQQTNTISSSIGVGTGGVTEAFKNRVILPFAFTNEQTDHVIGHELVHAFQYHIILSGDSTNLQSLANIPLWMVEGLAEYLSIGRNDSYTAMWMRDAVLQDDVPELKKLASGNYFPYRYGQAFWSYVTGKYGDQVIRPLFQNTAILGLEGSVNFTLGTTLDSLSDDWIRTVKDYYAPYLRDQKESKYGRVVLSEENSGYINVSPAMSPNGKYVVFLSERDVFSTDLYVAETKNGKVISKIYSSLKDSHLDAINSLESAGTWSPNSRQFAFIGFKKGRNVLIIKNVESGKQDDEFPIDGVPAFTNPTWSPNGKEIVFSGLVNGQTDLYSVNLKTKRVTQITDDKYSEIHASFNEEGTQLVFATDEASHTPVEAAGKYTFSIATLDYPSGNKQILPLFDGANNLNPVYDNEGNIYFLSNRDGYRNLYHYNFSNGEILQMTDYLTGISGITNYSPAIAASLKNDKVLWTHYFDGKYSIYRSKREKLLNKPVDADDLNFDAGVLPLTPDEANNIVDKNLAVKYNQDENIDSDSFKEKSYKSKIKLDHISGGTGVAVGSSNTFSNYTGLQGGIGMLFGDMLGNNQIFGQLALNGEVFDAGGQIAYLNRKNRIAWGISGAHIPLRTGYQEFPEEVTVNLGGVNVNAIKSSVNIIRIFNENLNVFAHYPFSSTLRLEGSVGGTFRSFRWDLYDRYYDYDPSFNQYYQIGEERTRQEVPDELPIDNYYTLVRGFGANVGVALVGDNSYFGLTAPLAGHRFRVGVDRYIGNDDYTSFIADYRKYFWLKPVSFAFRAMSYTRFENEVNSLYPFYVGNMGFVRGYGDILRGTAALNEANIAFGELLGSKLGLVNAEIRLPFTGPRRLALIPSKILFSDINVFFDAGVAFDSFSHFTDGEEVFVAVVDENGEFVRDEFGNVETTVENRTPPIVSSVGFSVRVNLFGALIAEPYWARQLVENGTWTFGLNIVPGW